MQPASQPLGASRLQAETAGGWRALERPGRDLCCNPRASLCPGAWLATSSSNVMGHFQLWRLDNKSVIRLSCPCPPLPRPWGPRCSTLPGLPAFLSRSPYLLLCVSIAVILSPTTNLLRTWPLTLSCHSGEGGLGFTLAQRPL